MNYRQLRKEDLAQIWSIDRSEQFTSLYRYRNGRLFEEQFDFFCTGWPSHTIELYGSQLKECYARGGFFWGAFKDDILKAVIVLDTLWIGPCKDTLQLKFLHIDRYFRKQGIGKVLFMKAVETARQKGAAKVYISSNENKNTVDFYMHMGCTVTKHIEPELFRLEPEDIHLEYLIR